MRSLTTDDNFDNAADVIWISIVDDDECVRKAVERLCRMAGYDTACFESAEAYLSAIQSGLDHFLILDLELPGMSGLELLAALRSMGKSTPVVMISGHSSEQARQQAVDCGAIAFMQKPFPADALLDAINQAVARRSSG